MLEVHACNLTYLGCWDQEDRSLKPTQAKKLVRHNLNQYLATVGYSCYPELHRRLRLRQSWQKQFIRSHLNKKKLGMVAHACHSSSACGPR
jgi:hypothetical protein